MIQIPADLAKLYTSFMEQKGVETDQHRYIFSAPSSQGFRVQSPVPFQLYTTAIYRQVQPLGSTAQ